MSSHSSHMSEDIEFGVRNRSALNVNNFFYSLSSLKANNILWSYRDCLKTFMSGYFLFVYVVNITKLEKMYFTISFNLWFFALLCISFSFQLNIVYCIWFIWNNIICDVCNLPINLIHVCNYFFINLSEKCLNNSKECPLCLNIVPCLFPALF